MLDPVLVHDSVFEVITNYCIFALPWWQMTTDAAAAAVDARKKCFVDCLRRVRLKAISNEASGIKNETKR